MSGAGDDATTKKRQRRTPRPIEVAPGMIIGRYELVARLGAGAMGQVWAAIDPQLEREVAIKLVHPQLLRQADIVARMVREARAMAKVSHRAVIAIHDAGEIDDQVFLAMELVRGSTLGEQFKRRTAQELADWRRWLTLVLEAGRGLAAAHEAGVLHRDFKPDNVLVDETGRVCVGDFGLATLGESGPPAHQTPPARLAPDQSPVLTMTGALLGTPAYMSLEQLRGLAIDARSDQFSFCVVAYEAIYGERPFELPSDELHNIAALDEVLEADRVRAAPFRTEVPDPIRQILLRGLASAPARRWPDLDALVTALEPAMAPPPAAPAKRARRWPFVVAAVAIVAAAIAGLVVWWLLVPPPPKDRAIASIPLRTELALSPSGHLAIASDRIEVRELAGKRVWTATMPKLGMRSSVTRVEMVGENVVRWSMHGSSDIYRWDYTRPEAPTAELDPPTGLWIGSVTGGDLVVRPGAGGASVLALAVGKSTLHAWQLDGTHSDTWAISPSRRRVAYIATGKFDGHLVVTDVVSGKTWRSGKLPDLTAVAMASDDAVLYATASDPTIQEAILGEDSLGPGRTIHSLDRGFAGRLLAAGRRLMFVAIEPVTRVRVIQREPLRVRDYEASSVAGEVGWTADGAQLTRNPATHAIEARTLDGTTPLDLKLDAEPANATLAGDILIVAERGTGGRKLVARSLKTGAVLWVHPVGTSLAARCAADLAPPCYVALRVAGEPERYEVVKLDPATGVTDRTSIYTGGLDDFAVDTGGAHVVFADGLASLREIDVATGDASTITTGLAYARSVAYDAADNIVVAGSSDLGTYIVGLTDRKATTILTVAEGEILSLVRPSPKGDEILTQGRALVSSLREVVR
ncbi:MAG: serine/threonine-protein kinase [Kofleriaceae bacterium]